MQIDSHQVLPYSCTQFEPQILSSSMWVYDLW